MAQAHIEVKYNPNTAAGIAAYVTVKGEGKHYEPNKHTTELVIGNISNYGLTEKKQVLAHELGHVWGIADLYDFNNNLNSIYSNAYAYNEPTRHDKNAMRICLNDLFFDTGNGWKYQKSPGVWAKDQWINKNGKAYFFDSNGIKQHEIDGNVPTTSMILPDGVYEIQGKTSGKLIHSASSSNGAVAHLWASTTNPDTINNQRMSFNRQSDGTYKITVLSSGSVLDDTGSSYNSGTQLKFCKWHGRNNQRWYVVDCGGGFVKIINKHSGCAVDIWNNRGDNGTIIQQYKDTGADAQRFRLIPANLPTESSNISTYCQKISSKTSNKLIGSSNNNVGVTVVLCENNNVDILLKTYRFDRQSDGTYKITDRSASRALTVPNYSYANGTLIRLSKWEGTDNQKWYVVKQPNGFYKIINKHSGCALTVYNNATENGTKIVQKALESNVAQEFRVS